MFFFFFFSSTRLSHTKTKVYGMMSILSIEGTAHNTTIKAVIIFDFYYFSVNVKVHVMRDF